MAGKIAPGKERCDRSPAVHMAAVEGVKRGKERGEGGLDRKIGGRRRRRRRDRD